MLERGDATPQVNLIESGVHLLAAQQLVSRGESSRRVLNFVNAFYILEVCDTGTATTTTTSHLSERRITNHDQIGTISNLVQQRSYIREKGDYE